MEEKERYEWNSRFDEAIKDNQTGDIVNAVEVLNQQDKRMKELQQQLAENNEFFNAFACKDFNEFKDFISTFMLAPHEEQTLIRELKQQLAEKDEEIKHRHWEIKSGVYVQDKISFALEQLEKVKEKINDCPITDYDINKHFVKIYQSDAIRQLDNQIKQLKELK